MCKAYNLIEYGINGNNNFEVIFMVRNYKRKANQTRPEKAGSQNLTKEYLDKNTAEGNGEVLGKLRPLFEKAQERRGTNWSAEKLIDAISEFFIYCEEHEVKVYKGGLALWLGCHKGQIWEWENNPSRYGAISEIIRSACEVIEGQYINRAEQYPTANLFLLRTSHGHVETSKVDVKTSATTSAEEVEDIVSKLGLDKPKK